MKDSSLCLQVGKSPPRKDIIWTFNKTLIVLDKEVTANYTDKVDYYPSSLSLCVNKLSETDSGIYEIVVSQGGILSTETHILLVQGKSFVFLV